MYQWGKSLKDLKYRQFVGGPRDGLDAWNLNLPYIRFDAGQSETEFIYHVYKRNSNTGDYKYIGRATDSQYKEWTS